MKALSKQQEKERSELAEKIGQARQQLATAIAAANARLQEIREEVQGHYDRLIATVADAQEWRENVHTAMNDYYTERSERWQEGEAGSLYREWMDAWGTELAEVDELVLPEEIDEPEGEPETELMDLPASPGEGY